MAKKLREKGRQKLQAVLASASAVIASTDPQGSYTGRPVDPDEKPVQDADDL